MGAQRIGSAEIRTLWLASLGGALEFYDFVIFVFLTNAISRVFFAANTVAWAREVGAFGIFAVGYLARPLGGVVMGHYGDTIGRKKVFTFSILLMAIPTLLIGLIPTYSAIGVAAPLLLVAMRVLQGIAIGGEAPGGWVFVAEHAPPDRTGFAVGLLTAGLSLGIFLGSLITTGIHLFIRPEQILRGYWRIPFLLGGVFGLGALALRRRLSETPVFQEIKSRVAAAREIPLKSVLRNHGAAIAASILSTGTLTAAIVVVILMSPSLLSKLTHGPVIVVQVANLAATVTLTISTILVGIAADRFGLWRTASVSLALLVAGAYALYADASQSPVALIALYAAAGVGTGAVTLTPLIMVKVFPPAVRYSGVSFSYNIAYAAAGGLTPPLVAWLFHLNRLGPAHYVAIGAVAGLIALSIAPLDRKSASPQSLESGAAVGAD